VRACVRCTHACVRCMHACAPHAPLPVHLPDLHRSLCSPPGAGLVLRLSLEVKLVVTSSGYPTALPAAGAQRPASAPGGSAEQLRKLSRR
jgi:hypothetical protein